MCVTDNEREGGRKSTYFFFHVMGWIGEADRLNQPGVRVQVTQAKV